MHSWIRFLQSQAPTVTVGRTLTARELRVRPRHYRLGQQQQALPILHCRPRTRDQAVALANSGLFCGNADQRECRVRAERQITNDCAPKAVDLKTEATSTQGVEGLMPKQQAQFCSSCGGGIMLEVPEGDDRWRHVCQSCGQVHFFNPKLVVGCLVESQGRVLLCKRAIEPCKGRWTLPAGYLELGESTAEGAARETLEEASADVSIIAPFAHYDIPMIGQTYLLFRAKFADSREMHSAGSESLETRMVAASEVPWDEIAFSSITLALKAFFQDLAGGTWHHHHAVIDKKAGSPPNDPNSYLLKDHIQLPLAKM